MIKEMEVDGMMGKEKEYFSDYYCYEKWEEEWEEDY